MRRILKAIVLGQDPDALDPDDIALLGLHRDGLLASLGEESRCLLEALVDELVCLDIGPAEAPERLGESAVATSPAFVDAADEYVALLRSALDAADGVEAEPSPSDRKDDLPFGAVVSVPPYTTSAAELLTSSALVALLAPGSDERDGWIARDRHQQLRSMLIARGRIATVPPPAGVLDRLTRSG